jgi:glucokinase
LSKEKKFILAGDIGGTKTNIGVFMFKELQLVPVKVLNFTNADYNGIEEVLSDALSGEEDAKFRDSIAVASFGVAGHVESNQVKLTNIGWDIDGKAIAEQFNIPEVMLMNDLVATGWGLSLLDFERDIFVLQEGEKLEGNGALISAGTGLGEASLLWNGKVHVPSPSEGGHGDFAPRSKIEVEFLEWLLDKYEHVSYERVLSGPGLVNIYEFIIEKKDVEESKEISERFISEDRAKVIAEEAHAGRSVACKEALDIFISVYASEAGNMILRTLGVNGLYIGGGIAPKILETLKEGAFIEAFRKKGRFTELMSKVPVYVILNEAAPLMGAAGRAAALIRQAAK